MPQMASSLLYCLLQVKIQRRCRYVILIIYIPEADQIERDIGVRLFFNVNHI
jgi:hypothetical protein